MQMKSTMPERRHTVRKKFGFYMRVLDDETDATIGHLVDVSIDGLQLETTAPLPSGQELHMHMELTPDVSDSLFMFIAARALWSLPDDIMPNLYHVGFRITNVSEHDKEIYKRLLEKYGK
jgi:hypothetical protein